MAAGMAYGNQLLVNESALKRRSSHVSNSNITYKSGYSPIDDDLFLYKTGIRGRKKYTLYAVIVILFLIALVNILTTFVLLGVLRLGYGMDSMEFIPSRWLIRFLQSANIDVVIPANGIVGGFDNDDLHIIGNNQPVFLRPKVNHPATLEVNPDETIISDVNSFTVVDPRSGRQIFSTEYGSFGLPKAVKKLNVQQVVVNKVSSPVNRPLSLKSHTQVRMRGNEGMRLHGSEVVLAAGEDIFLKSRNASITLEGLTGVIVNVDKLARSKVSDADKPWQYKICVCMPRGNLFLIPLRMPHYTCANAVLSVKNNPCQ